MTENKHKINKLEMKSSLLEQALRDTEKSPTFTRKTSLINAKIEEMDKNFEKSKLKTT
jgi:hypothetical protein